MKNILVIGLGRFGQHLCRELSELGNEVMAVDTDQNAVEAVADFVSATRIGDCTNAEVLKSLGVNDYDECVVCIGNNFQNSLEITSQLKELGAKHVISKANRDIQAKFLSRNGADTVVYPNRDLAEKLARMISTNHVFDYIELTDEYAIYEIPPLKAWIGKSIRESDIRAKYHVNVLGTKKNGQTKIMPSADHIIEEDEHMIVMGAGRDVDKIIKRMG